MPYRFTRLVIVTTALFSIACGGDGPAGDNTRPTVVSISPTGDATGVSRTATISATFSEPIDAPTLDLATLAVTAPGGAPIAGTVAINENVVTFTPGAPLAFGTTYSVRVSTAVTDRAGNALSAPVMWGFTTVDNPVATVIATNPASGATGVRSGATISATFSEPVVVSYSGSLQVVSLRGRMEGTIVVDGATVTFTPNGPLTAGVTYTAILANDIVDLQGTPIQPYSWTFSTAVDAAPEQASPIATVGVAVTNERVDAPGDVDEFQLQGTAGAEWVIFVQSGISLGGNVRFTLLDGVSGAVVAETTTQGNYPEIEQWSLGRIVLPRTGPYILRVTANAVASYAFRVDVINRAPESAPAVLVLGETVSEAIGTVADIDEFSFEGVPGQEATVQFQLQSAMSAGITMDLIHGGQVIRKFEPTTPSESLNDVGTGRMTLAAGTYTVRVYSVVSGAKAAATGTYRLALLPIDRRPENGAVVRLDGPAITGTIDPAGDVDEYELTGTSGQIVIVRLSPDAVRGGTLVARLLGADGTRYGAAYSGGFPLDGGINHSWRIPLPYTGTYRLQVQATPDWSTAHGAYTLEAYTVSTAPEHVPAPIAIGATVAGERIDRPGDVDVFTFAGQPGRDVSVFLGTPDGGPSVVAVVSPQIYTYSDAMSLDGTSTGRITMVDSTYTITVSGSNQSFQAGGVGEYVLRLFPIDPQPEGRSAAYTLGDTVSNEPLYPAGDIDEYLFTLVQTTTLDIFWEAAANTPSNSVTGRLYTAAGAPTWDNASTDDGAPIRRITLAAGSYRFSVLNRNVGAPNDPGLPKIPTLSYRFALVPRGSP